MEIKQGIVQRIKADRKALAIENIWYNSYKPLENNIKLGDEIKLTYAVKGEFNNIRSIEVIKEAKPEIKESTKEINDTGKNCILMQSVIIYLTNKDIPLKEIVKMVTESYKLI